MPSKHCSPEASLVRSECVAYRFLFAEVKFSLQRNKPEEKRVFLRTLAIFEKVSKTRVLIGPPDYCSSLCTNVERSYVPLRLVASRMHALYQKH